MTRKERSETMKRCNDFSSVENLMKQMGENETLVEGTVRLMKEMNVMSHGPASWARGVDDVRNDNNDDAWEVFHRRFYDEIATTCTITKGGNKLTYIRKLAYDLLASIVQRPTHKSYRDAKEIWDKLGDYGWNRCYSQPDLDQRDDVDVHNGRHSTLNQKRSDDDQDDDVIGNKTGDFVADTTYQNKAGNVVDLLNDRSDDDSEDDEAIQLTNINNDAVAVAASVGRISDSSRHLVARLPPTMTVAFPQHFGSVKRLSDFLYSPIQMSNKRQRPFLFSPERKDRFAPFFSNGIRPNDFDDDDDSALPEAIFSSKYAKPKAKPNAATSDTTITTGKTDMRCDQLIVLDSDDDYNGNDPNSNHTALRTDSSRSPSSHRVQTNAQTGQANQEVIEIEDDDPVEIPRKRTSLPPNRTSHRGSAKRSPPTSREDQAVASLSSMNAVDQMCWTTVDDITGLPIYHFTVYSIDETLFEFRVDIRQSSVPNAGLGAFLTFLGAKVLKPEARRRAEQTMNGRDIYISDTLHPLTAESPYGFGIELKLTGCNLHGNGNNIYWPKHLLSSNGTPCAEKIAAIGSEDQMKVAPQGIGFLGLHKLDDYKEDPNHKFCSRYKGCGVIDLGRYGPFQKEDRKQKMNFDLKSFIFGQAPSEWCFDVEERLHDQEQIIDITDDETGEPHQLAKAAIPMYVNEVGHYRHLKQNVFAKEKDERTVQFYLDLSESIAKGETVELLVDNFEVHDVVRERKGCGRGNLVGGLKSDEHQASALKQNFSEREAIVEMVSSLSMKEMFNALEFLSSRICSPVVALTEAYLDGVGEVTPTNLQWSARRRMHWLSGVFMKHLKVLENRFDSAKPNLDEGERNSPEVACFEKCTLWLEEMKWPHTSIRKLFSEWDKPESRDDCTPNSFSMEICEEVLFDVRKRLIEPLDESVWCPLARSLIAKLCKVVATVSWTEEDTAVAKACLRGALMTTGNLFIKKVIHACDSAESAQLEFSPSKVGWLRSFQSGAVQKIKRPYAIASPGADDVGVAWIPVQGHHKTSNSLNKQWYLLWQVLFVVNVFATEYYAVSADGILEGLCTHAQLNLSVLESARTKSLSEMISTAPHPTIVCSTASYTQPSEGGTEQDVRKEKPEKSSDDISKPGVNKFLFFQIVWACLTKLGWTMESGNRPTDNYFLPPGIRRERGHRIRTKYFDSCLLVLDFIRNDGRWRNNEQVKASLVCFTKCTNLLDDLRKRGKVPMGELKLEWLLKKLEEQPGSP